jgi:hypothetical protein
LVVEEEAAVAGEEAPVVPVEMPQLQKKRSKRKKKLILVVVWICLVEETATVEITRFICFQNPINKPIQQDVFACSFFSLAYDDSPSMRPNRTRIPEKVPLAMNGDSMT